MKKNILIVVLVVLVMWLGYSYFKRPMGPDWLYGKVDEEQAKTYINEQFGFSFNYPADFESDLGRLSLPGQINEAVPATVLTRAIDVEHCGLSGLPEHCTDKTKNPEIKVAVVQGALADISKDFVDYEKVADNIFRIGVEGEGLIYYLVVLNAEQTIIFEQSFIDENNVLSYQNKPNYLPLAKQRAIMNEILKTFKIK